MIRLHPARCTSSHSITAGKCRKKSVSEEKGMNEPYQGTNRLETGTVQSVRKTSDAEFLLDDRKVGLAHLEPGLALVGHDY
jgi:hypothetical protein